MSNDSVDYGPVIADLEAKIAAMQATLNGLRAAAGLAVESIHGASHQQGAHGHNSHAPAVIKADTFFRKTVIESILLYLKMSNKNPQTTREIVDALERGGCKSSTSTVSSLMSRRAGAEGDITKVTNNTWGLSEWYGSVVRKKKASKSELDETASEANGQKA